jgi:hypothetical protein
LWKTVEEVGGYQYHLKQELLLDPGLLKISISNNTRRVLEKGLATCVR